MGRLGRGADCDFDCFWLTPVPSFPLILDGGLRTDLVVSECFVEEVGDLLERLASGLVVRCGIVAGPEGVGSTLEQAASYEDERAQCVVLTRVALL